MISLIVSIISLITSILVSLVLYFKLKSIYINLFNLSKGLDVIFSNQDKIIELTKLKSFIQLTNEEEQEVRFQINKEKQIFGKKGREESIRSPESNSDDKKS
jgi:hypothetical protein